MDSRKDNKENMRKAYAPVLVSSAIFPMYNIDNNSLWEHVRPHIQYITPLGTVWKPTLPSAPSLLHVDGKTYHVSVNTEKRDQLNLYKYIWDKRHGYGTVHHHSPLSGDHSEEDDMYGEDEDEDDLDYDSEDSEEDSVDSEDNPISE